MLARFFRSLPFYLLVLALPLGWFTWGLFTGTRLLGDDNESTETLNAASSRNSHGSHGHGLYFHK